MPFSIQQQSTVALITLNNASLAFGADPILDHADLIIESGDRIGLIGRNGAGKSSLLKVLDGSVKLDDGTIQVQQNAIIGRLVQEVPSDNQHTVASMVALGANALGANALGSILSKFYLHETPELQNQLTQLDGWSLDQRVKTLCSKFELDPQQPFRTLSGGLRRRALLAQAMVLEPDVLLLDEPTNHLDIDTILWLEAMLSSLRSSLVIVSHDRQFIDKLCNRIVELDRGMLSTFPGNYASYLTLKAKADAEEDRANAKFDKKLAEEEVWIRKGIQARRTRNEGRVRALKKMREERKERRNRMGTAQFALNNGQQSGKLVIEAESIKHHYEGDSVVIDNFSLRVMRGDRVGFIGPNGCGKSTLIKILTQQLEPSAGSCRMGSNVQIAYLDQYRSAIKDNLSVQDNVSGETQITINGKSQHILSYLQDFLFTPKRAREPAAKLSGGERNRLMLAKLFTQPFNLLVLDEPTNDLDFETLELLEQILMDFDGSLLLVSHDRAFLDNIVTSTVAFEGAGNVREYVGGYTDWLDQRPVMAKAEPVGNERAASQTTSSERAKGNTSKKLSYKLQRELDALPAQIEQLEIEVEKISACMQDAAFYAQSTEAITAHADKLKALQNELNSCYSRWEELEALSG